MSLPSVTPHIGLVRVFFLSLARTTIRTVLTVRFLIGALHLIWGVALYGMYQDIANDAYIEI